ncbi:L,D-transpeptidase family protein [Sphingomicrobium sediminis]|uniref:L,D-transpeptidase family protein n=1 Tax=Sphingomicrobium sediminis TaxID=2950949 RepID=A0A9X2EL94_9SPHN|nr:L,D-transpeptidase family protein [Sphingomicrobium sediminis]MCM8557429.1 L,D-transpeptidase family protein [Sphingomicrobium sediminis]
MSRLATFLGAVGALVLMTQDPALAAPADDNIASERFHADLYEEAGTTVLYPGEYHWFRNDSGADVHLVVDLSDQVMYVYQDRQLLAATTVSTGKDGHETPLGKFEILEKNEEHYSNLYDDAPMPYMQRLTWDGIALHAGSLPGYPASHGCIRLPMSFAEQLFELTDFETEVYVVA